MAQVIEQNDGSYILRSDWHPEDIRSVTNAELSDEQCAEIMDNIANYFDANQGINWGIIEWHVSNYLDQNGLSGDDDED